MTRPPRRPSRIGRAPVPGPADRGTLAGPWEFEPDRLDWMTEAGFHGRIIRSDKLGNLCGYIAVDPTHPWYAGPDNEVISGIDVHGGLTFFEHDDGGHEHFKLPPSPNKRSAASTRLGGPGYWWVLGFDAGHYGDLIPRLGSTDGYVYRNIDFMRAEVESLARQAFRAATTGKRKMRNRKHMETETMTKSNSNSNKQPAKRLAPTPASPQSISAVGGGSVELIPEINAEFAADLLARRHPNQRTMKEAYVTELADAMLGGRWRQTFDLIRLDKDMLVIDGQHRLAAVVKSGVPLKDQLVATVTTEDAIIYIDQNRPRNLNDIRATLGQRALPKIVSGAIISESCDWSHWRGMPRDLQVRTIAECEFVEDLDLLFREMKKASRNSLSSVGAMSGALRCIRTNRKDALKFFRAVFAMDSTIDGVEHPMVRVLYSYLVESKLNSYATESRVVEHAHKCITAYNHWRAGRMVTKLIWKGGPPPAVVAG